MKNPMKEDFGWEVGLYTQKVDLSVTKFQAICSFSQTNFLIFNLFFFLAVFDQKLPKYWVLGWQHYFKGSLGKEWAEKRGLKSRTF